MASAAVGAIFAIVAPRAIVTIQLPIVRFYRPEHAGKELGAIAI
jgi:hypothetical protein